MASDLERAERAPRPRTQAPAGDLAGSDTLLELLRRGGVLALTGAGISTESGIPDYRGPHSAGRDRRPMRYQEFVAGEDARRRYWAGSSIGWPRVQRARPNSGHRALAELERSGAVFAILTQNVDGLHQQAGSRAVVELHGSLAAVRCLDCGRLESRRLLQQRLARLNGQLPDSLHAAAPDGDADIAAEASARFVVPNCLHCAGVLKPDVVFFGENVPRARVDLAWSLLERAEALLILGSSLTVFSGYRFVARAAEQNKPVAIVNDGPTRGDPVATVKIEARLGTVLPLLVERLR